MEENKNKNIIEATMDAITEVMPEMEGVEGLAALISLPDDKFEKISPLILSDIEKSLNNSNDKLALVQYLNIAGMTSDDLIEQFEIITKEIDNQFDSISQIKKDFIKNLLSIFCNVIMDAEGITKKIIQIPIELCHSEAKIPNYANVNDAGMDIYALEDINIAPGETVLVKTGIKVAIPKGYEIQVRAKSGIALKTKMRLGNSIGTIDSGYRDEIGIIIENIESPIKDITYESELINGKPVYTITSILYGETMHITKGQKIAQLVLNEIPKISFYEVESVGAIENDGRNGGFGSTGLK